MGQPTLIRSSAGPIDDRPPALSRDRGRSRRVDVRADRLTRNARQADVFPAERRDVLEQGRIDGLGFPKQSDGAFQVKRVPQRDGGDHQVKTAGAILLIFEGTVADLAQPIEKYSLCEGVSGFALIEASRDAVSQGWILQPGQREQRALDPADFAQGQSCFNYVCGRVLFMGGPHQFFFNEAGPMNIEVIDTYIDGRPSLENRIETWCQGQKWKTAILQAKVLGLFTTWLPHRHAGGCHQSLAYHSPENR
jgi:hypothetical protein